LQNSKIGYNIDMKNEDAIKLQEELQIARFDAANEKRRADQLGTNVKWLIDMFDRMHYVMCPKQNGSWQDRVKQVVETVENDFGIQWNKRMDEIGAKRGTIDDLKNI